MSLEFFVFLVVAIVVGMWIVSRIRRVHGLSRRQLAAAFLALLLALVLVLAWKVPGLV